MDESKHLQNNPRLGIHPQDAIARWECRVSSNDQLGMILSIGFLWVITNLRTPWVYLKNRWADMWTNSLPTSNGKVSSNRSYPILTLQGSTFLRDKTTSLKVRDMVFTTADLLWYLPVFLWPTMCVLFLDYTIRWHFRVLIMVGDDGFFDRCTTLHGWYSATKQSLSTMIGITLVFSTSLASWLVLVASRPFFHP